MKNILLNALMWGGEKTLQFNTRKEVQLFTRTSFQQRERGGRYLISVALGGVVYAY